MSRFTEGMNPEQTEAVLHVDGPIRLVATAGSGKTRVVVHRIARLVEELHVPASDVLAVTFSRKAADEMNERLAALVGETDARVGTWHSLALQVLREEWGRSFRDWEVDTRDRIRVLAKEALGYRGVDWKGADVTDFLRFVGRVKSIPAVDDDEVLAVAQAWYDRTPSSKRTPSMLVRGWVELEERRLAKRLLTFDDMLVEACLLLRNPDVRAQWAGRWSYVIQDEAQDESPVQGEIATALASVHRNYMVVGDSSQAIYAFRGASPKRLIAFPELWPDQKTVAVARCYRCGLAIADAANGVLRAMAPENRVEVDGAPVEIVCESGRAGSVEVVGSRDFDDEGEAVAKRVEEHVADGGKLSEVAVLYRTNAQSRGIEEAMLAHRIPYVVLGGGTFYERREVADLLAYLRVASGAGAPKDVRRSLNAPFRFLGARFQDAVEERLEAPYTLADVRRAADGACHRERVQRRQVASVETYLEVLQALQNLMTADAVAARRPANVLDWLVRETSYMAYVEREEGEESVENSRGSNVRELVRTAERFATVPELLDYVDAVVAAAKDQGGSDERVTLCSIHRAKGLEWDLVFLAGACDGILPHARAEDLDEERRLFYVAATRARESLVLSVPAMAVVGGKVRDLSPSQFIGEAGLPTVVEQA